MGHTNQSCGSDESSVMLLIFGPRAVPSPTVVRIARQPLEGQWVGAMVHGQSAAHDAMSVKPVQWHLARPLRKKRARSAKGVGSISRGRTAEKSGEQFGRQANHSEPPLVAAVVVVHLRGVLSHFFLRAKFESVILLEHRNA